MRPRLLAQAITTTRAAGASGRVLARADSAYYLRAFLAAAVRHDAWFSVTARMNPQVVKAIAAIDDDAWTSIHYPNAVFDEQADGWVSDAQVAEVAFTAFTSLPKAQQITCRLVVRRVKRQQPRASDGSVQPAATTPSDSEGAEEARPLIGRANSTRSMLSTLSTESTDAVIQGLLGWARTTAFRRRVRASVARRSSGFAGRAVCRPDPPEVRVVLWP